MMSFIGKTFGLFGLVAFIVLMLVFFPFVVIWSLNTLFPVLAIQYNFWTWVAVIILGAFIRGSETKVKA